MPTVKTTLGAVAMAALLVLAGCAGPISNTTDTPGTATPDNSTATESNSGTVEFYLSDEENAINDFRHLNVTITKVGFHRTDGEDDGDEMPIDSTETTTLSETAETDTNTTVTTTTTTSPPSTSSENAEEADGNETEDDETTGWVEHDVNQTADLTELKGANATKIDTLGAPNGSYDKVFVYVSDIEATLENGESVNVKLPSEKLHINKGFTIGSGENVSFVFDISVHKAGNSGKYILKPVVSESGTGDEVDIKEKETKTETDLTAEFVGPVEPGTEATLKVTDANGPVGNATVEVNDETVGQTDDSGTVTFTVPTDAEELEVAVTKGDAEAEVKKKLSGDEQGNQSQGASN